MIKIGKRLFATRNTFEFDPKHCLYKTLGVNAADDTAKIKKSYYTLAQKYHPDKCGDCKESESKFKSISTAWEVLGDEDQRKAYDAAAKEASRPKSN